jgi:N-acetylglucosamine kinase-like BadF-type ATPase
MRSFFLGVDGGGSKTVALVGDNEGRVLSSGKASGSNFQTVGPDAARQALSSAVAEALRAAGAVPEDIQAAAFALAGADFAEDYAAFNELVSGLWPGLNFRVWNDTWGAWRGGTETGSGVVAIAGTGSNAAGRNPQGLTRTGIGMSYEFGTRGGATHMLKDVLYHVFRAGLQSGPPTALLPAVLQALSVPDVDALAHLMYRGAMDGTGPAEVEVASSLIPGLFDIAAGGDRIAQQIIIENGTAMGEMTGGLIRMLGMERGAVEVVAAGSLFERPVYPLYYDSFLTALHTAAPGAWAHKAQFSPAVGAYYLVLESLGVGINETVRTNTAATQN